MEELEIKKEFDVNHLQCRTCLCTGRILVPLGKYVEVYRKLTCTKEYYDTQIPEEMRVCWECNALLWKVARFQQRVEQANEALRSGQIYTYGTLSSLTSIVLNDTHTHTIYIDGQINSQTETTKSEIEDLDQVFTTDDINDDGIDEINDDLPQDFVNVESEMKTEIEINIEDEKVQTKSKMINRWAQERAQQNKKPKFRILTNMDIDKIIRIEDMDDINVDKCIQNENCSESQGTERCKYEPCEKGFKSGNEFSKHRRKHHKKFKKDQSRNAYKDQRHLSTDISKQCIRFSCLVCEYHTYCEKEKEEHAERHKKVFQCLKCELLFSNRREFYKHYKEWHEKFVCDYCGISFKMKYCIKEHIRKQHSPFECVACNRKFARYNGLWLHNKIHHTTPSSAAAGYCVECDRQYPDIYRYKWHLANSARHKPRKKASAVDLEWSVFYWIKPRIFRQHIVSYRPYLIPCPGCDKVFSKNIYMKDHYNLVHLKFYKYRCEDCDKNFIRNADLMKHRRRVHEGILPPKNKICYMCGRGFTTNKILSNHVRTHTGERPFPCAHCPARFTQRAALTGHARALHHTT